MAKIFAIVNGLSEIFDTVSDGIHIQYDTTHIKSSALSTYDVDENTLFYIESDSADHLLDYKGTFIYTHNELFNNYDNKGGQYVQTNITAEHAGSEDEAFLFGEITPLSGRLWTLSYHIQAYSNNVSYNSEYDVCLYGYGTTILSYYAINAHGEQIPYSNHIITKTSNTVKIGLVLSVDAVQRNLSFNINYYLNCQFAQISEYQSGIPASDILIDATLNGLVQIEKEIKFTPSGAVSAPIFNGTEATISVSGQVSGTNSESAVTIDATTASINSLTDVGALPSFTYTDNSELITFNAGELPESEAQTVWTGYTSATAAAQTFTGATITLSGTFTPAGTISAPTFTGDEITIKV